MSEHSAEIAQAGMTLADALRDAVRVNRERPEWTKRRMPTLRRDDVIEVRRRGVYFGFVSQVGDEWSASTFDSARLAHTLRGFFQTREAAEQAVIAHG